MNEESFDTWVPAEYLRDYYQRVEPDEVHAIRFYVEASRGAQAGPMLCFGCGPTLHHVFSCAPYTKALYLADYLPENLAEIERWRQRQPGAHDWRPFVRYTLSCELGRDPSDGEVAEREERTRASIAGLVHADATLADPLGSDYRGFFQTVLSPFCADSITASRDDWFRYSRNIATLVKPGGRLLTTALARCHGYKVGDRFFPSPNVDVADMRGVLLEDFVAASVQVEARAVPEHVGQGYEGILLASADKASNSQG
ncbi:MAG: guanitoxin biosynthesis pre-guanitoxin forming N-methyltransferase GntF [Polyangiaceae bacterium]